MVHILIPTTRERRERLGECLEAIKDNSNYPHSITVYENTEGGCVPANLRMIEDLKDEALVCVLNDDMIPQYDWLRLMVEAYNHNGDCLVYPDDGIRGQDLATIWLCTASYMRKYYHSGYIHSFADQELTDVSKKLGKLVYVPESKVIHKHYTRFEVERDNTYKLQNNSLQHDLNLYERRK